MLWHIQGSSSPTDCKCNQGYTAGSDGGPCTTCGIGKYKDTDGADPCKSCPNATWSAALGSTSPDTCVACPADSTSNEVSMLLHVVLARILSGSVVNTHD